MKKNNKILMAIVFAVVAALSLVACADTKNVNVVFHINNGFGTISQSAETGKPLSLPSGFSNPGYTFDKWYTDSQLSDAYDTSKILTEDMTLYAGWTPIEYAINYNLDNGQNSAQNPSTYNIETDTIVLQDATKNDYEFVGWYSNAQFSGAKVTQITKGSLGNIDLYAKFHQALPQGAYKIEYVENGGTVVGGTNPTQYTENGGDITLFDLEKTGYTFEGWFETSDFSSPRLTVILADSQRNFKLFAKFVVIEYNINYSLDGGTNNASNPDKYSIETATINLLEPTKTGYEFLGWFTDPNFVGTSEITQIVKGETGAVNLYAKWGIETYTIEYHLEGGALPVGQSNPASYDYSQNILLVSPVLEGKAFVGWYDQFGQKLDYNRINKRTGNLVLTAHWADFALGYNLINGGTEYEISRGTLLSTDLPEQFEIPASYNGLPVTKVADSGFSSCKTIKTIIFPSTIKVIGQKAFESCSNLRTVELVEGLVEIGLEAFADTSISGIKIPSTVTKMGSYVFGGCGNLKYINFETTATSTPGGWNSYWKDECPAKLVYSSVGLSYSLINGGTAYEVGIGTATASAIILPSHYLGLPVVKIANQGFMGNSTMISIKLGANISEVGTQAFYNCSNLATITVNTANEVGDEPKLTAVNNVLFANEGKTLICYPIKKTGESYDVPFGVNNILAYAFAKNTNLNTVNLSYTVKNVGSYVFDECTALTQIKIDILQQNSDTLNLAANWLGSCPAIISWADANFTEGLVITANAVSAVVQISSNARGIIKIPETYDGKPVERIANFAFNDSKITEIWLPASLKVIGDTAFSSSDNLMRVVIASNSMLETIGESAFDKCEMLEFIDLEMAIRLKSIGYAAFYQCKALEEIIIPASVTTIGEQAFKECSSMESVVFEAGSALEELPKQVFTSCSSLKTIKMPSNITKINQSAFSFCSSLISVTVPATVKVLGDFAFYWCGSLTTVILQEGLERIGDGSSGDYGDVFTYCESLSMIIIPSTVTYVCKEAFGGWSNWQEIHIKGSESTTMNWSNEWKTSCYAYIEYNCTHKPIEPEEPEDPIFSSGLAFSEINGGTAYEISMGTTLLENIVIPSKYNKRPVTKIADNAFKDYTVLLSVEIPSSVTEIGNNAFEGCINFTTVSLPSSITKIGAYAFAGCAFETIEIPQNVEFIKNNAFEGCLNLKLLTFAGNQVMRIEQEAFKNCISLPNVELPNSLQLIYEDAFSGCETLSTVKLGTSITTINDRAFLGCYSLSEIFIPSTVSTLGSQVFGECDNLRFVQVGINQASAPSGLEGKLKEGNNTDVFWADSQGVGGTDPIDPSQLVYTAGLAFTLINGNTEYSVSAGTADLTGEIVIPWYYNDLPVTTIEKDAFKHTEGTGGRKVLITSLTLGGNITTIGESAFEGCALLQAVSLPKSVTSVAKRAFYSCTSLASFTFEEGIVLNTISNRMVSNTKVVSLAIPYGVTILDSYALADNSDLEFVYLPETLQRIGDSAFDSCTKVKDFYIPASVTYVGGYAFWYCTENQTVHTYGSDDGWNQYWRQPVSGKRPSHDPNCTHPMPTPPGMNYTAGLQFEAIRDGYQVSIGTASAANIVIPDVYGGLPVLKIKDFGFQNSEITSIVIPDGLTDIGVYAFAGCANLTEVVLPDSILVLGSYAFFQSGLQTITLSQNISILGAYVFYGTSIDSIDIPSSVTKIGSFAFGACSLLTSIDIPVTVDKMGMNVFDGWTAGQTINIEGKAVAGANWNTDWNSNCAATIQWDD